MTHKLTPIRRKYFTADIPSDCSNNPEERFELAILQAKESFTDWVIPCNWRLVWDSGEAVRVVRESGYGIRNGQYRDAPISM